MIDRRLKHGLELFNQGKFYECHEAIEGLWLETDDEYRDLYKGLIQAAAALHQLERGVLSGALSLYRTSTAYLRKYEPRMLGLNVEKLIQDMNHLFSPLAAKGIIKGGEGGSIKEAIQLEYRFQDAKKGRKA
ncbi:MAG: DUF309 domain-containing protein [Candidatus Omnitrophica bacterium]|nr:DUF309 domain-containing protein [Candidatus Omnitrophota bacterium]